MNNYLWNKFKGKYRVLPEVDKRTNDVPRDLTGVVDADYDDFYIPSSKNLTVRHGYRDELSCFIESSKTATSVIKSIYKKLVAPKEVLYTEALQTLLDKKIILSADEFENELFITFKADRLDSLADTLKLKTRGSNINPMSNKNFYTIKYIIPPEDEEGYKNIMYEYLNTYSDLDKLTLGRFVNKLNKEFLEGQQTQRKQKGLGAKEYIHDTGQWNSYLEYLKKYLPDMVEQWGKEKHMSQG